MTDHWYPDYVRSITFAGALQDAYARALLDQGVDFITAHDRAADKYPKPNENTVEKLDRENMNLKAENYRLREGIEAIKLHVEGKKSSAAPIVWETVVRLCKAALGDTPPTPVLPA